MVEYPHKKLVIILDSVDQLTHDAYNLEWVEYFLPPNIKMVYSTLPEHERILDNFRGRGQNLDPIDNFLEVESLDASTAHSILSDWLRRESRRLSTDQLEIISKMFKATSVFPLYVKVIFDIVAKWPSYFKPDQKFQNCKSIDQCIMYLFESLEFLHGKLLFARTVIYMSVFKNGISESELEDILSLDDDVLYDIFEFHAPPIRKLPVALWSRIKHDLKAYLVEKEIDETRVVYWYHRRFIEVATANYIAKLDEKTREYIFCNVTDFFNETWKHTPKPFKYNEFVARKKNLASTQSEEVRNTGMQPTFLIDEKTKLVNYNKRKLREMPAFVSGLTQNLAIPLGAKYVWFNYHFLTGMMLLTDLSEITMNLIDLIEKRSTYAVSVECASTLKELRTMVLLFLQSCIAMKNFPRSSKICLDFKVSSFLLEN
jgi:hypothetical protein